MKSRRCLLAMTIFLVLAGCSQSPGNEETLLETQTQVAADVFASQTASIPTATPTPTLTATATRTPTPAHTSTPKNTATNTPTPTATLIPALVAEWENMKVNEVCLSINQQYPQFDDDFEIDIFDPVSELINAMEMDARAGDTGCEMIITIGVEGTSFQQKYSSSGETLSCYTGARVDGYLRAETEGYPSIDIPLQGSYAPMMIERCAKEPTTNVDWTAAWSGKVVPALAQIWGPPVAVAAVNSSYSDIRAAGVELVKSYGPQAVEAAPLLVAILEDKQGGVAWVEVAGALGLIGPPAIEAVPFLIDQYGKELESQFGGNAYIYRTALRRITGQEFEEENAELYRAWWEMYTNADIKDLENTLKNAEDPGERKAAAGLLFRKGGLESLPVLMEALVDPSQSVREEIAIALRDWGPDAAPAARVLTYVFENTKDTGERMIMGGTLEAIGAGAIPALIELGAKNTDNCRHYTNQSRYALDVLQRISGEKYDLSKWGKDMEGVCKDILEFLERCQAYYDEHQND